MLSSNLNRANPRAHQERQWCFAEDVMHSLPEDDQGLKEEQIREMSAIDT